VDINCLLLGKFDPERLTIVLDTVKSFFLGRVTFLLTLYSVLMAIMYPVQ